MLLALLEKRGSLVTREELRRRLWAEDTFVDVENGLNTAVSKLREALGELAQNLETLARRGYRFSGSVEELGPPVTPFRALLLETKRIESDITVVDISGRIVLGPDCKEVEWLMSDLLQEKEKKIVFDLTAVSHIDSTGVEIIVVCCAKARMAGGELRIDGARGLVEQILRTTKVDAILDTHPTTTAAVQRFAA